MQRPDPRAAREAAAKIERLADIGRAMEGVDKRFATWGLIAGVFFIIGVWAFFDRSLVAGLPIAPLLTSTLCLCVLPAVAGTYAWRILPRTRADSQIDELNRAHFLPNGGLYFPADQGPARVIRVNWTPPVPPKHKDPRDRVNKPGQHW